MPRKASLPASSISSSSSSSSRYGIPQELFRAYLTTAHPEWTQPEQPRSKPKPKPKPKPKVKPTLQSPPTLPTPTLPTPQDQPMPRKTTSPPRKKTTRAPATRTQYIRPGAGIPIPTNPADEQAVSTVTPDSLSGCDQSTPTLTAQTQLSQNMWQCHKPCDTADIDPSQQASIPSHTATDPAQSDDITHQGDDPQEGPQQPLGSDGTETGPATHASQSERQGGAKNRGRRRNAGLSRKATVATQPVRSPATGSLVDGIPGRPVTPSHGYTGVHAYAQPSTDVDAFNQDQSQDQRQDQSQDQGTLGTPEDQDQSAEFIPAPPYRPDMYSTPGSSIPPLYGQRSPAKLPKAKSRVALVLELERVNPERMHKFLAALEMGATPNAAAGILGILPSTMARWLERGRTARRGPYKQLYAKVTQAVQMAAVVAGVKVREKDPLGWLTRGPGKMVEDDWSDQPRQVEVMVDGGITTGGKLQVQHVDIAAALRELREAGVSLEDLTAVDQTSIGKRPALPAPASPGSKPVKASTQSVRAVMETVLEGVVLDAAGSPVVDQPSADDDDYDEDDDDNEGGIPKAGINYLGSGQYRSDNPSLPLTFQERLSRSKPQGSTARTPGMSVAEVMGIDANGNPANGALDTEAADRQATRQSTKGSKMLSEVFDSTAPSQQTPIPPRKKPGSLLARLKQLG